MIDGYITASQTAQFFQEYAKSFDVPIQTHMQVISIERSNDNVLAMHLTNRGTEYGWSTKCGDCHWFLQSRLSPDFAKHIPSHNLHLEPSDYHQLSQLPHDNVLIVRAFAVECQIAQELMGLG